MDRRAGILAAGAGRAAGMAIDNYRNDGEW
jgi:hypothetical protein